MSNARNLSNLLGTGTTIATASIADDAITSAKIADDAVTSALIADDAVVTAAIADDAVTAANIADAVSFGKVLQVVSSTKTNTTSTSNGQNSQVATGVSASITPASTSNKILVMYNINFGFNGNPTTIGTNLLRGSTVIVQGDAASSRPRVTANSHGEGSTWNADVVAGTFLDSPSTTSATTYSLTFGGNGSVTLYVNRTGRDADSATEDGRATSTMTLLEIEA